VGIFLAHTENTVEKNTGKSLKKATFFGGGGERTDNSSPEISYTA
jgi:hypothetical protein